MNKKVEKPNCYDCKYKGNVVGSAHSSCNHPSANKAKDVALSLFIKTGEATTVHPKDLDIRANPHGIKSGWFFFPINFDPTWLENCNGFKQKKRG